MIADVQYVFESEAKKLTNEKTMFKKKYVKFFPDKWMLFHNNAAS